MQSGYNSCNIFSVYCNFVIVQFFSWAYSYQHELKDEIRPLQPAKSIVSQTWKWVGWYKLNNNKWWYNYNYGPCLIDMYGQSVPKTCMIEHLIFKMKIKVCSLFTSFIEQEIN